jgi:hypothetical protein
MRIMLSRLTALFRRKKLDIDLDLRIIANSLTEQCGNKTFQIFWVLGGLGPTWK